MNYQGNHHRSQQASMKRAGPTGSPPRLDQASSTQYSTPPNRVQFYQDLRQATMWLPHGNFGNDQPYENRPAAIVAAREQPRYLETSLQEQPQQTQSQYHQLHQRKSQRRADQAAEDASEPGHFQSDQWGKPQRTKHEYSHHKQSRKSRTAHRHLSPQDFGHSFPQRATGGPLRNPLDWEYGPSNAQSSHVRTQYQPESRGRRQSRPWAGRSQSDQLRDQHGIRLSAPATRESWALGQQLELEDRQSIMREMEINQEPQYHHFDSVAPATRAAWNLGQQLELEDRQSKMREDIGSQTSQRHHFDSMAPTTRVTWDVGQQIEEEEYDAEYDWESDSEEESEDGEFQQAPRQPPQTDQPGQQYLESQHPPREAWGRPSSPHETPHHDSPNCKECKYLFQHAIRASTETAARDRSSHGKGST